MRVLFLFMGISIVLHVAAVWSIAGDPAPIAIRLDARTAPIRVEFIGPEKPAVPGPTPTPTPRHAPRAKATDCAPNCLKEIADAPQERPTVDQDEAAPKAIDAGVEALRSAEGETAAEPAVDASEGAAQAAGEAEALCWRQVSVALNERARQSPLMHRRRLRGGTVVLRFGINVAGRAEGVEIETSSGNALLDEAAVALLDTQLPQRCPGRGRWAVHFKRRR